MLKTNFIPYIILVYPNTVAYNSKGNITSRKLYSGESLLSTDTFTYGTNSWEDRLTGYNNKTIAYDDVGNPVSYMGATLTWRGRELASYAKGNKQISYSYDVDGMRYRKVVKTDGVETARYDYVYSAGTLILLTYTANGTANTARFVYDSFGEPRGFILNNSSAYLYLKNAQGDITGIVDENGEVLLTYSYTAWGKVTYSATDMESLILAGTLSNVNPFTYRGYCYDFDIGLYYLQSRYYDPTICRFINADSTEYLGSFKRKTKYLKCEKDILLEKVTGYNLFSYCENDAVNQTDYEGCKPKENNPENLEEYIKREYGKKKTNLGNKRTGIKISGNNITISANFEITGSLCEKKVNGCTYRSWFTYGIRKYWMGNFKVFGYTVNLKTYATQLCKSHVTVKLENKTAISNTKSANRVFWKPGKDCKIYMYKKDPRNAEPYSGKDFAWVAAHEFGHVLGLADQGDYTENTIMGKFEETLSPDDIETVLESFIKKRFNGGA